MIFGGELVIFLSESGFPGLKDVQDVIEWFLVGSWWFLFVWIRISRIKGCTGCYWM